MFELNKVMVIGNLTRDPESITIQGGTLAKFGMAINKSWKNKAGEWNKETSFINITAFGAVADFAAKWLKKGTRVYIEGELKQTTWESKDGSKRSDVGIQATNIRFAGEKDSGDAPTAAQTQPQRKEQPKAQPDMADSQTKENKTDDLPF